MTEELCSPLGGLERNRKLMRRALAFQAVHWLWPQRTAHYYHSHLQVHLSQAIPGRRFDVCLDLPPVASSSKARGWLSLSLTATCEPLCSSISNLVFLFEVWWLLHIKFLPPKTSFLAVFPSTLHLSSLGEFRDNRI